MDLRFDGLNYVYLDEKLDGFSNLAVGLLIRSMGHSLKIAYIDTTNSSSKLSNFFENLSLNKTFIQGFNKIFIEFFTFKTYERIQKSIIPLVEFNSINKKIFLNSLSNFDIILLDNYNIKNLDLNQLKEIFKLKSKNCDVIIITKSISDYNLIKAFVDIATRYIYSNNSSLLSNKNITNIYGDGRGKSLYSYGYIIRNFINKSNIKLIYFDKGDNIDGELIFFKSLKNWSKFNNLYGTLDFVVTGISRFNSKYIRKNNGFLDKKEAQEAYMLLKTALKKQTPVIADELSSVLNSNLLNIKEVVNDLKSIKKDLLITGKLPIGDISLISRNIIEVKLEKTYQKNSFKIGIDF